MYNSWGADYFISIHANEGGIGAETFYFGENTFSLAKTIKDTYSKEMNIRNRRTKYCDNLAVIRHTNHPSIIHELGFIEHKKDAFKLKTKRLKWQRQQQKDYINS